MTQSYRPVVLVIDPDALTLMGLSATLHHENMEVHGARTPIAALKAAENLPIDIIVCDNWVTNDGGRELIKKIRQYDHLNDVPVLFLDDPGTAGSDRSSELRDGIQVLYKPIDLGGFVENVKKSLWMPHLVQSQMTLRPHSFDKNRSGRVNLGR